MLFWVPGRAPAPLLFWPQTSRLQEKKMLNTTPGYSSAVISVVFFHCSPCARTAAHPAHYPEYPGACQMPALR